MDKNKEKNPIMSSRDEEFMAFCGLVQWSQAVIVQKERISIALSEQRKNREYNLLSVVSIHSECHFFVISANKLIDHIDWVRRLDLYNSGYFSEFDAFPVAEMRNIRNMREHITEYLSGSGHTPDQWVSSTPEFAADASSLVGQMIGGRLNWATFGDAARNLLLRLLAEPPPRAGL